ncbi:uncharacterized protein LOC113352794 [Papaver somniferum]|uniref:uncharacterized protein LOC113352794 n=1 Tax=Papaver somniferum TaxID=3469 RepID=UPI000E6F5009|nr:uncharacterized protein LOC113352794 [Papaver somniferum]
MAGKATQTKPLMVVRRSRRLEARKEGEKGEASVADEKREEAEKNLHEVEKDDGDKDMITNESSKTLRREKRRVKYRSERRAGTARRDSPAKREDGRGSKMEVGISQEEDANSETITTSSRKSIIYRKESPYEDYEEEDE